MNLSKEKAWSEKRTQDGSERNVEGKRKAEEEIPVRKPREIGQRFWRKLRSVVMKASGREHFQVRNVGLCRAAY